MVKYLSIYGRTYGEVKKRMKQQRGTILQKDLISKSNKSFDDVLKMWIENNRLKNKGGTINKYQSMIDAHISPALGNVKITQITAFMVNTFLQEKLENGRLDGKGGLSSSYVRTLMIIIQSAIKFAVDEQLREPLKSPILKPSITKKDLEILSRDEQKRLEENVMCSADPTRLGIYISLQTGLRIGEVCALSWNDIDFENQIIRVRHTIARIRDEGCEKNRTKLIVDDPKTKSSVRDIPISPFLTDMLRSSYEISDSEYVVSTTPGFVSPRTYDYRYHKIIAVLGITQVNYHALRHTFATRCIEAGVDVKSLSEILGHANVAITLNTYVHSSMDMKRTQLEKMFVFNS